MLGEVRGTIRYKEPLAYHTSLRIGGTADIFVIPEGVDDVRHVLNFADRERLPVLVLGGGNNLLVKDRGVRGVVIKLGGCFGRSEFQGEDAVVGAAVGLQAFIREAAALELGGLEGLVGIPATIGGALRTSAETSEAAIVDFVSAAYYLHPDGTFGESKPTHTLGYRALDFPDGAVLVGCRLQLRRRATAKIRKDLTQRLKAVKASQPLALASAGYVWKNPQGKSAARVVEGAGLKGKRVNGAEIPNKHTNLVVNRGQARAADVLALMDMTRERVAAKFGITLEHDLKIVGE